MQSEIVSTRLASAEESDDEPARRHASSGGRRSHGGGGGMAGPGALFGHMMGGLFRH
jgi:hypothetical protein